MLIPRHGERDAAAELADMGPPRTARRPCAGRSARHGCDLSPLCPSRACSGPPRRHPHTHHPNPHTHTHPHSTHTLPFDTHTHTSTRARRLVKHHARTHPTGRRLGWGPEDRGRVWDPRPWQAPGCPPSPPGRCCGLRHSTAGVTIAGPPPPLPPPPPAARPQRRWGRPAPPRAPPPVAARSRTRGPGGSWPADRGRLCGPPTPLSSAPADRDESRAGAARALPGTAGPALERSRASSLAAQLQRAESSPDSWHGLRYRAHDRAYDRASVPTTPPRTSAHAALKWMGASRPLTACPAGRARG